MATSLTQLLTNQGRSIALSVEYMENELGYSRDKVETVLQREFPDVPARTIEALVARSEAAITSGNVLQLGGTLRIKDIPIYPNAPGMLPSDQGERFVTQVHVCTRDEAGNDLWQTMTILSDSIPTQNEIQSQIITALVHGRLPYQVSAASPQEVFGSFCGYDIVSVFRSY